MFRLFHGTFEQNIVGPNDSEQVQALTGKIEEFFAKVSYAHLLNERNCKNIIWSFQRILAIKFRNADILDIFHSIQYFPIGKFQFLRVHNFIEMIESNFPSIEQCIFLYNEQLVWWVK